MINKVHNMDCIEGMGLLGDCSVDLVVTDPPYLMNYRSNRRTVKDKFEYIANDKDSHSLISDYIKECHRIMKDDTAIYMFCSWHHIDFFKVTFEKYFKLKNIIVWNKNNHGSGDLKGAYAPKHELILYGHKGRPLLQSKRIPDVIDFPKINSANLVHPTEKPVGLLKIFIENNSSVGDTVFDGFLGGGSTALASMDLGRNFVGFELDQGYCDVAKQRLSLSKDVPLQNNGVGGGN